MDCANTGVRLIRYQLARGDQPEVFGTTKSQVKCGERGARERIPGISVIYEVTSGFGFPDHRALIAHFHLMQATRREWLRRNQEKSRCSVQWGYLSNGWL